MTSLDLSISSFINDGFNLKNHLINFLHINNDQLEQRLLSGVNDLAALHPGAFTRTDAGDFYEDKVGDAHLIDLASWHLNSSNYIADTLRLQQKFAHGKVLDFGGGIGTHALANAMSENVEHVFFVDINETNREFVKFRAKKLGLEQKISFHKSIEDTNVKKFDSIVCLDVLEHLENPAMQLDKFHKIMSENSVAIFNWYFYKGDNNEYPFHLDEERLVSKFFETLQYKFIETFHPLLITTRVYKRKV